MEQLAQLIKDGSISGFAYVGVGKPALEMHHGHSLLQVDYLIMSAVLDIKKDEMKRKFESVTDE